ncbi:Protein CBG19984 [Caenorhabditis briggsae]|uniref:Protein CBG19984 n=1 Tax=Caenorhabditis briggsae TaxID=6238 RepID=A8XWV6_CAEBR|nr:Protein CBG19984 [Caenorhabditis briggsae]CAP37125.2 Protein CBG19984 [Caenorhabditis briggsae]
MSSHKPVHKNNNKSTMKTIRDDIDYVKESDGYQKYRIQFREPYKHFLGCVGLDERDWNLSRPRADLRCNALSQQLTSMYSITSKPDFFNENKEKDTETKEGVDYFGDFDREIRPHFEKAIAAENQYYDEMKTKMQVIHDFYTNDFEAKKAEFASLGPELEALQKSRPTDPEQIQQMDKVMNRFTELQRLLKSMIQPGLTAIQSQHLKSMRECMEAYQKLNDNWSNCFVSFSKFKPKLTAKRRIKDEEKGKDKADKLGEDDRDI